MDDCHLCDIKRRRMKQRKDLPQDATPQPDVARLLQFLAMGEALLNKTRAVARLIEQRCRAALHGGVQADRLDPPPPGTVSEDFERNVQAPSSPG
jgi:hypothetical protein